MSNDQTIGCCDEPPCPTVSLLCNSISASKSKCGFYPFQYDILGNGYRTQDVDCDTDEFVYSDSITFTWPAVPRYLTQNDIFDHLEECGQCTGSYECNYDTDSCEVTCGELPTSYPCLHETVSNEYTTALLKTNTESALPDYATCFNCVLHSTDTDCDTSLATGQGCTCSAFRNLSTDETSYTIRRFKYKFRFTGSVTCRLKILWNETFKPTLASPVTFCDNDYDAGDEDPDPSHWTITAKSYDASTSGDPCGPDIGPPSLPVGDITEKDSSVFTVNEPSTNGTTYMTDIRWTILDGNNDTDVYDPAPIDYTDPCNPIDAEPNCIPTG